MLVQHRASYGEKVARARDDLGDARIVGPQRHPIDELQTLGSGFVHEVEERARVEVGPELDVDELGEAQDAERQRRRKAHVGLGVKALRIGDR